MSARANAMGIDMNTYQGIAWPIAERGNDLQKKTDKSTFTNTSALQPAYDYI